MRIKKYKGVRYTIIQCITSGKWDVDIYYHGQVHTYSSYAKKKAVALAKSAIDFIKEKDHE